MPIRIIKSMLAMNVLLLLMVRYVILDAKSIFTAVIQAYVGRYIHSKIGPNATTMADFYQQLSTNNATWTIIDRGEPESYVAVWELLDYIGQGVTLVEVRSHLKAAWEYLAIHNSDQEGLDDELLELLIQNVEGKKNVYKFFNSIISCLVSKKGIIDKDVCTQFEDVMKKAIESQKNSFASSPKNFIENGYELLKKDEKNDELVLLFNLDENCTSYFEANNQLAKMSLSDLEDFTYNFDEAKEKIAEKGMLLQRADHLT